MGSLRQGSLNDFGFCGSCSRSRPDYPGSHQRTIWVASQLGNELTPISGKQAQDLITLRESLGMSDKRSSWKECELCDNSEFRPGFVDNTLPTAAEKCSCETKDETPAATDAEATVQAITDQIMAQLKK